MFIAGDNDPVGATEVSLPNNFLIDKFNLKADYDNLPIGLPLSYMMSFSINLNSLVDDDYKNWSDLRTWILRGHSDTQVTIGSISIYIPNMWILYREIDSNYRIEYIGVQEKRPGYSIELSNSLNCEFTVDCIDIISFCLRNITIDYLKSQLTLIEETCTGTCLANWGDYLGYRLSHNVKLVSIQDLMSGIQYALEDLIVEVSRGMFSEVNYTNNIDVAITYYEQQTDDYLTVSATTIDLSDIYIIAELIYDGSTIGGMLYNSKSNNNLYKFNNCYDLLKYWCEQWFVKVCYHFDTTIDIVFNKLKEANYWINDNSGKSSSSSDIIEVNSVDGLNIGDYVYHSNYTYGVKIIAIGADYIQVDTLSHSGSPSYLPLYTISSLGDLMIDKITITTGEEAGLISRSISHLQDVIDEHTNKNDIVNTDLTTIEYTDNTALMNDKSLEFELIFHNHLCGADGKYNQGSYIDWGLHRVIMRVLYYKDGTDLIKVHDYITVDTGNETIEPGSDYNSESFNVTSLNDLQEVINRRNNKCGMGHVLAKSAYQLFGDEDIKLIDATVPAIMPNCLGQKYVVDLTDIIGSWYSVDDAILTNIDLDLINNKANIKLFMY